MKAMLLMTENWTIFSPRDLPGMVAAAKVAEDAGIAALGISEHIVLGPRSGTVPKFNPRDFDLPNNQDPFTPHPSSTVLLSAFAAVTSKIQLIHGALLAVLRHPLQSAKDLATLDLLSQGRLTVFPAVSWQEDEYQALGKDFHKRGKMLDEILAIWRLAWNESPASFEGEFYQFDRAHIEPKPWRAGGPQIWITGATLHPAAIRRIVQYGDGFAPGFRNFSADDKAKLKAALHEVGRDLDTLQICTPIGGVLRTPDGVADIDESLKLVPELRDNGVTMVVVKPSQFIRTAAELGPFCEYLVGRLNEMG